MMHEHQEQLLRSVIREFLLRENAPPSDVESRVRAAVTDLANFINDDPEMLSTFDAIKALNGAFYGVKVNGKITPQLIEKEVDLWKKFGKKLFGGTPEGYAEYADIKIDDYEKYVKPRLLKARVAINKRPKDAPIEGKTWGKWLFASYRNDVPLEKEEPAEESAYQAIRAMLYKNRPLPGMVAKNLQRLVANGEYLKFLSPQGYDTFYRGMFNLDTEQIAQLLGRRPEKADEGKIVKVTTSFQPKKIGSSWSVDESIATKSYAAKGNDKSRAESGTYSVTLFATKRQNPTTFILNPDTIYKIADFRGNESLYLESANEVYAVGSVELAAIRFWMT